MHQQIISPERRPVRRYNRQDLERIEKRDCAYRIQGRTNFGSSPASGTLSPLAFGPLSIAGCVAWFDMQDAGSFTNAAGTVTAITNKASSVSWTEATNGPAYSATAIGSHPGMDFNGTTHRIISTEAAVWQAVGIGSAYTIFYVAAFDTLDRADTLFGAGNSGTNFIRAWGQSITGVGRWSAATVDDVGAGTTVDSAGSSVTGVHLHCWHASSTQISLQVDGGSADPNNAAYAPAATTLNRSALGVRPRAGLTSFFDGKLGELILYNSRLGSTDIATLTTYLNTRWA